MVDDVFLLDSITDAWPEHAGSVAVSGSHGGLYPATVASRAGLRAVAFNDAGRGFDEAGVAGVLALETVGMAAAAVDCMSCRIGSAADALQTGVISITNASAARLGVRAGMTAAEAVELLRAASAPSGVLPSVHEARSDDTLPDVSEPILLVDSASMVRPEDAGRLIVTGSHGGLIGGDPARAIKAEARFAVFNDAGFGKDAVGVSRLPTLETRGIPAVTVSHASCRIGDARSAVETGLVSAANASAKAAGVSIDTPLREALRIVARARAR